MIELGVPWRTPSGNQLSGYHWSKRARYRRQWELGLRASMLRNQLYGCPEFARVKLLFIREAATPIKDADNAYAGLKPVLDAMVSIGLLLDDGRAVIEELRIEQVKCRRNAERTLIQIEVLTPAACPTAGESAPS